MKSRIVHARRLLAWAQKKENGVPVPNENRKYLYVYPIGGKWRARKRLGDGTKTLGTFQTKLEAALAVDRCCPHPLAATH